MERRVIMKKLKYALIFFAGMLTYFLISTILTQSS